MILLLQIGPRDERPLPTVATSSPARAPTRLPSHRAMAGLGNVLQHFETVAAGARDILARVARRGFGFPVGPPVRVRRPEAPPVCFVLPTRSYTDTCTTG